MINLKYTYQPSHSIDEVNTQVTNLVELLKSELLQAATNENIEAVTLKVDQTSDDGLRRIAQVQAAVGDTAAKVGMLATYNQATGSITVSAALVNGIEQSDITLTGDQITLNGNVTIANNFKLSGDHIVANTITANEIASNYVYAGSIDASQITAGTIDAARIDASSISVQALINAYGSPIRMGNGLWFTRNDTDYVYLSADGLTGGDADVDKVYTGDIFMTGSLTLSSGASIGTQGNDLYINAFTRATAGMTVSSTLTSSGKAYLNDEVFAAGIAAQTAQSSNPNVRCQDNTHRLAIISGSSKRFKHDIKPIEEETLDPHKLYDVPVIQYIYNNDYLGKEDPRYEKPIAGFIAEDIDKIYPIACDHDEKDGRPNDWNVRYIVPPMLALIQEQNERIKRLEARYGE